MMTFNFRCFLVLLCILFGLIFPQNIYADEYSQYEEYMKSWSENIELAKNYLSEAETALQNGDALVSCANQRKASEFGISATESLIKATKIYGPPENIPNLEDGLNKWKAFGEFCK